MHLDGYFVTPMKNFIYSKCFNYIQVAHERADEGYKISWFDAENTDDNFQSYYVTIPEVNGDLYFMVESYMYNTIPNGCIEG